MVRQSYSPRVTRSALAVSPLRPTGFALLAAALSGTSGCAYRTSSQPQVSDIGAKSADLSFEFRTQPRQPVAGVFCIWDLKVLDNSTEKGFKSFADKNGRQLRFAVISADGKTFQLTVPDYKEAGHFVTEGTFTQPGTHRAFAFFTPFGGQPVSKGIQFQVARPGTPPPPPVLGIPDAPDAKPTSKPKLGAQNILQPLPVPASLREDAVTGSQIEKSDGGLRVALQTSAPRAGQGTNLTVVLHDATGKPPIDTEPLWGDPVQMIAISADQTAALAPELIEGTGVRGAACVFKAQFPTVGLYTLWTQFSRGGKTWTVPFVIRIAGAATVENAPKKSKGKPAS